MSRCLRGEIVPLLRRFGAGRLAVGAIALLVLLSSFVFGGPPPAGDVAATADPFDGPGAALDITLKLLAVLALAYVALGALRKYGLGHGLRRGDGLLQVLESTTLAPNRAVYVVRVGERRLVLGVTTSQITTLAELEAEEAVARTQQPGEGFQVVLDEARERPLPHTVAAVKD